MSRMALVQAGAPSPVLNASLGGFLAQAAVEGEAEVIGVRHGANGLAAGDLQVLRSHRQDLHELVRAPGAVLGAGRRTPIAEDLDVSVRHLHRAGVEGIAVAGGNGSMALAGALLAAAARQGTDLRVVGIPKTVDNDLLGTDRSPGYLTAGTYALEAVRSLGADLRAMAPLEQVRLVEVLGRGVGWVALAVALGRDSGGDGPDLLYTPEAPLTVSEYLVAVEDVVRRQGHALVVVAEGGVPQLSGDEFAVGRGGRLLRNGVVHEIADRTRAAGFHTRAEVLGMVQRSASWMSPPRDREDAWQVGVHAAHLLRSGVSGVMVSLDPLAAPEAASTCSTVDLAAVADGTRPAPLPPSPGTPTVPDDFRRWWRDLVAAPTPRLTTRPRERTLQ